MGKKVIFLDIDGTLTEPGHNVPPDSALEAVKKAQEAGNYVFLCSGRNYAMLSPLLKYGFDGVVASAGGYIVCGDNVIFDCPMTEEQKNRAMKVMKENNIIRTIECMDGAYADDGFRKLVQEQYGESRSSEFLRWREQVEKNLRIFSMERYQDQPAYKFSLISPSMKNIDQAKETLEQDFLFCIQDESQGFVNCELINRKFNKGTGVIRVCDYLNIPVSDSVGFGDSMNDKEMLETAGLSICMGNGSQAVKELADEVCPSVTEDGIWKTFQKYHLM